VRQSGNVGRRIVRGVILLATSTLVVCGVKGPPRPPPAEIADAGAIADGGAAAPVPDAGTP
jgi:predicted small lipoprotein YifL